MPSQSFNWDVDGAAPGDRVLFLAIPPLEVIEKLSMRIVPGIIVCLGEAAAVYEARRAAQHVANTMFMVAGADDIPWQDGFFSRIYECGAPSQARVCREIVRVLAPGGLLRLATLGREAFEAAGLTSEGETLRKPEAPPRPPTPAPLPVVR